MQYCFRLNVASNQLWQTTIQPIRIQYGGRSAWCFLVASEATVVLSASHLFELHPGSPSKGGGLFWALICLGRSLPCQDFRFDILNWQHSSLASKAKAQTDGMGLAV